MVRVASSRGGFVNVEMLGVGEVFKRLRRIDQMVESNVELAVVKGASLVEDEVKESIIGKRSEPKSVDTGRFGNSIEANKTGKLEMTIEPKRSTYPGTTTTTLQVALAMEFGTTNIKPRRHFRNTEKRNKKKVQDLIKIAVKKATK